ncbi:hypothetical protein [Aquabacterium sp.]|uniref:hypothetical protein n=1 Tax=Aquabacterium sp. TaxID=1872578 RepID=UPI0035AE9BC6
MASPQNWLLSATVVAALTACGGGGGGSSSSDASNHATASSTSMSGTVASGAPMVGTVTVIDSTGATRTVTIQANGSYTVDVSGMTGPFLFRAVGTVAGRTVALASAATSSDTGNTINITPFTDLLVANIVGMAVENYLANHTTAPALTSSGLEAASTALTQRLAPIFSAAGLSTSYDLLHASFAADHTGFDKLMDAVTVAVDATTDTATIVDKLNTGTALLTDNLASTSDTTQATAVSTTTLAAVDDLTAIETLLTTISGYFASSVPSASNTGLRALFADDLLDEGLDKDGLLSDDGILDPDNIGLAFASPVIVDRSSDGNQIKLRVSVSTATSGAEESVLWFKKVSGAWKVWGDQSLADVSIHSTNGRGYWSGAFHYNRYLEVWVGSARNDVATILVTGPGLSNNYGGGKVGVKLKRPTSGATENFVVTNTDGSEQSSSLVQDCADTSNACIDVSLMTVNSRYTLHYYDTSGVEITPLAGTDTKEVPLPPVSNADAAAHAANWFADFNTYTPTSASGISTGVSISATWTLPTDSLYKVKDLGFSANNDAVHFSKDLTAAQTSATVGTWSSTDPASVTSANIWIYSSGPQGLRFFTSRTYP